MRDVIIPTYGNFDEYNQLYGNRSGIDWQKEVFENHSAISQQHKFTISGGSKTSKYLFSYTRNDDKGIWYGSGLKRDNFRMKINQVASEWLNPVSYTHLNAVLSESERRSCCALIDFGADTTTISVYKNNILRFLTVLPLGGNSITREINSCILYTSLTGLLTIKVCALPLVY